MIAPVARPNKRPFERWVKTKLDAPGLDCRTCEAVILNLPEPCQGCPNRLLDPHDEVLGYVLQVYRLLAMNPFPENFPSWETLFEMVGVQRASMKRQVYERVCLRVHIERQHKEEEAKKDERTITFSPPSS